MTLNCNFMDCVGKSDVGSTLLYMNYYNKAWFYLTKRSIDILGDAGFYNDISFWQHNFMDVRKYRRVF